ncbi:ABC transporter permease [Psychroflexus maritimus]|uniref:ABC transporter permease n=1 Tax=Psychroflexus maritimus TaxID=2714865 RepID=A0A967DZ12_9FLAO|nr:ABC transporter permease [Psychroflexus maritimus]NGZ89718.1 ABC transporter permease [Psychroflexus maritimus]
MFSRDKWSEILESLTSNMFRTILTAFGVFWGIFILVILLASGTGLENGVKKGFSGVATNSMFMWAQTASQAYKGLPKGRRYNFKLDDIEAIKDEVNGLKYVSPRNQLGGFGGANNVTRGLKSGAFNVYGDYPDIINQEPTTILQGRFINQNDINERRKVAVIGEGVLQELYDFDEDPLGTYIKIQGVNFMVIGIFKKKGFGPGDNEEASKQIYTPFTAYSQAFNQGENVGWMAVTAKDGESISELKKEVFEVVKQRHTIAPKDDRAIGHFDLFEQYNKITGLFLALNAVAYFVGIMVLISGVIGISNIMLIVVKERTNEIGVRRALGATPWQIKGQILMESITLTIIAGMTGIVFATGVLILVNKFLPQNADLMFVNPSVDLNSIVIALIILIISGLLAGLIPAQNAIKIRPVDALRTE